MAVTNVTFHKPAPTSPRLSRPAAADLLLQRLHKAFPVLKKHRLQPIIEQHLLEDTPGQFRIGLRGLVSAMQRQFGLHIENEKIFALVLIGKLEGPLPGIIVFRPVLQESKAFSPEDRSRILERVASLLTERGRLSVDSISTTLKRLEGGMPDAYFKTCAPEEIASHAEQIVLSGTSSTRIRLSEDGKDTFIAYNPDSNLSTLLADLLAEISREGKSIKSARLYTDKDNKLAIYVFDTGRQHAASLDAPEVQQKVREFKSAARGMTVVIGRTSYRITEEEATAFLRSVSRAYLLRAPLSRMLHHLELYAQAAHHSKESFVEIERSSAEDASRITLVSTNIPCVGFLHRLVKILGQHGLELKSVFVETLENEATTTALRQLTSHIKDQEPVKALVELAKSSDPVVSSTAEHAILHWGDIRVITSLLHKLRSSDLDLQGSKGAADTLISMGARVQEAVAINTFYVVKANGEPLDDVKDAAVIRRLKEDFRAAKWAFGGEFEVPGLHLRTRQTNFVSAAASFAQEMLANVRPKEDDTSWDGVRDVFLRHPTLTGLLVNRFEAQFDPCLEGLQYLDRTSIAERLEAVFYRELEDGTVSAEEREVLRTGMAFVRAVRTTNYFSPTSSLSFSLDPSFLQKIDGLGKVFDAPPFGVFYICGAGFRGYHIRFEDIARGGIRIIPHSQRTPFTRTTLEAFGDNYRLARTQDTKNIFGEMPEGGSKGVVVLRPGVDPTYAFRNYVDGLLDLVLGTRTLLFIGPDEFTGTLMDPGAEHAGRRGYLYPHTFTTGKAKALGGVPHDEFGITTTGVYEFERLVLEDLGLQEEELTKVQTGGPDGDLGSNEIKVTRAKTTAVVDVSGVAYDPAGLERAELLRLAEARAPIASFEPSKLSPGGFVIPADGKTYTFPDGRTVVGRDLVGNSATNHANHLLFWLEADIFVPAGGRQQTINKDNVERMFKEDGTPRFKVIVEGANVFITPEARLVLEAKGVKLIKDASANKGGVMSSSHEVLAAFLLSPAEMQAIYGAYVDQVKDRIRVSVRKAYARLKQLKGEVGSFSAASDRIGAEMKKHFHHFMAQELPDDPAIDELILAHAMPVLTTYLGKENMLSRVRSRVPVSYRKAIVAARLASEIVYREGLGYNPRTIVEEAV